MGEPQTFPISPLAALVIGNNDYANLKKLQGCVGDSRDLSVKLEALGFVVNLSPDADLATMQDDIAWFHCLVQEGVKQLEGHRHRVAIFYFAGHAVERSRRMVLLPKEYVRGSGVDGGIDIEDALVRPLNRLCTGGQCKLAAVLIFDACREDSSDMTFRGFDEVEDVAALRPASAVQRERLRAPNTTDFVFVWPCDHGCFARECPEGLGGQPRRVRGCLSRELVARIDKAGTDFGSILRDVCDAVSTNTWHRQRPWVESRLTFPMVLRPGPRQAPDPRVELLLSQCGLSVLQNGLTDQDVTFDILMRVRCVGDLTALGLNGGQALALLQVLQHLRTCVLEFAAVLLWQCETFGGLRDLLAVVPLVASSASSLVPLVASSAGSSAAGRSSSAAEVPHSTELMSMGVPPEVVRAAVGAPQSSLLGALRDSVPAIMQTPAGSLLSSALSSSSREVERQGQRFSVHVQPQIFSWSEPVKYKATVTNVGTGQSVSRRATSEEDAVDKAIEELMRDH